MPTRQKYGSKKSQLCMTVVYIIIMALITPVWGSTDQSTSDGIIVVIGLNDSASFINMASENALIHGIDTDAEKVVAVRKAIAAAGKGTQLSVARFNGKSLPYIDNLVNKIVLKGPYSYLENEIKRVLAPRGSCVINGKRFVKPVPADTDEWTHYLHDPSNNAVSHDKEVAPPRRMQWVAGPRYSRHHDRISSVNAVVSTGGRIFSIIDEGSSWDIRMKPEWRLTARDAYNGKLLWKRDIATWQDHMFRLKSGPAVLPRRLVAVNDKVYVTLGLNTELEQLDAKTGKTIQKYAGTKGTTEILWDNGIVYIICGDLPEKKWYDEGMRTIMAIKSDSGEILWQQKKWVVPGTLTVLGEKLYFYEKDKVSCLTADKGEQLWQSPVVARPKVYLSRFTPTLVATEKVILIGGGEASAIKGWSSHEAKDTLSGLDAATGKKLWTAHHPDTGYMSPEDIFVIDNMVWFGDTRDGHKPGHTYGLDLTTGEVKVTFAPDRDIYFFHHRCYRAKATDKYLLTSRVGIEFIDIKKQSWDMNHWIRGACLYGILPANGLIYAPEHPCACYSESKLDGFNAAAPAHGPRLPDVLPERLEKGSAYGAEAGDSINKPGDWPMYRHDIGRSGSSAIALQSNLKQKFSIALQGKKLTPPVVANGILITAAIDEQAVYAFDSATGDKKWVFIAGGRVDSAPTIYGNLVLFGSKDGSIYCVKADNGQLVWRYRVAPIDQRLVSYEQFESVWPIHGSVLVKDNAVYAVAGRIMFMDGGLRMVRLDVNTGKLLNETIMDAQKKQDGKDLQDYISWLNMPVAKPDILSSVGNYIYMRSQPFNMDTTRLPLKAKPRKKDPDHGAPEPKQYQTYSHLFCPTGFTDSAYWHRSYWVYGSDFYSGWQGYFTAGKKTPAGKIMVFDDENVYGFGRKPEYWRWVTGMKFHFFAASKKSAGHLKIKKKPVENSPEAKDPDAYIWTDEYPVLVRAMCKAGDTIYVAGPREVATNKQLDYWNGNKGGLLMGISAKTGKKTFSMALNGVPVFDGLIAADGALYVTLTNGSVVCVKAD